MAVWLELFYDLVFVAAILVLSDAVSHLHDELRVVRVVGVFAALWLIWLATTIFVNRFRSQDLLHRSLVLAQMFLVALVAIEADAGVEHDAISLSLSFGGLVASVAIMYTRAARRSGPQQADAARRARWAWAAAAVFALSAVPPWPWDAALWVLGFVPLFVSTLGRTRDAIGVHVADGGLDAQHLVERVGAFTIIVCGEAFVKVAIAVSGGSLSEVDVIALFFQFVLTFAIWTSYFEDLPHAGIRARRLQPWLGFHLLLQLAIAGTAIGVARLVRVDPLEPVPSEDIVEITVSLALVYVALALLGWCTRRRPARPLFTLRMVTAAAVVVVGAAVWKVTDVDLVTGVAALSVVALVYAVFSYRMTGDTELTPAA
jgi:low temperature requirement protein LtrA